MPSMLIINFIFFFSFIFSLVIKSRGPLNVSFPDATIVEDNNFEDDILVESDKRAIRIKKESVDVLTQLVGLLQKHSEPPTSIDEIISLLDSSLKEEVTEEDSLKTGNVSFVVFFIDEIGLPKTDTSKLVDHTLLNSIKLYISSDKDLAKKIGVPFPGVYGYNAFDKADYKIPYTGFTEGISTILTPILKELTVESLKLYDDSKLPKFFLFYDELPENNNKFFNEISVYEKYARENRDKIKIGILAYKRDKPSLGHFKINDKNLPAMVCIYDKKKYRAVDLTGEKFGEFIKSFVDKKVEAWEMTGDEPSDNKNRKVKVITRKNYKNFFSLEPNDNNKDSLVVFTSPNCRFCVELKPIIEKVGEAAYSNAKDKVIVGNVDMTENDFPEFDIKGYPTIALISNGNVHYYNGNRTVEAIALFIQEKGINKINIITGKSYSTTKPKDEDKISEESKNNKDKLNEDYKEKEDNENAKDNKNNDDIKDNKNEEVLNTQENWENQEDLNDDDELEDEENIEKEFEEKEDL